MHDLPDEIAALYRSRRHHILNERLPRRGSIGLMEFLWAATYFETGSSTPLNFHDPQLFGRWIFAVDTIEVLDGLAVGAKPLDLVRLSDTQRADTVGGQALDPDQGLDGFLEALHVPDGPGIYHANDGQSFALSIDLLIAFMARIEHDAAHRLEAITLQQSAPTAKPTALTATADRRGMTTAQIADLFECTRRTRATWTKAAPKWLESALIQRGARGGASSLWCPVEVAKALHLRKLIGIEDLNRRFSNPALAPWRDQWSRFYEVFSDADHP